MPEYEKQQELGNILKIHCCCYEENIFPWVQNNLQTPSWRFYWNRVPGGFLRFENEEVPLMPDSFYILPGYLRFSTLAKHPFSQFYIHFDLSERQPPQNKMFRLPADKNSLSVIRGFIQRGVSWENRQLNQLAALSVVSSLLLRLPEDILHLPPEYDPRIERVLAWIHKHLDGVYSNDTLAEITGMSRNGFLRLFENSLGESPQKYCRRKRIERACELLHFSDLSLEEIAAETGFSDRYHFTRVFWQIMHFTPASFRRQLRSRG